MLCTIRYGRTYVCSLPGTLQYIQTLPICPLGMELYVGVCMWMCPLEELRGVRFGLNTTQMPWSGMDGRWDGLRVWKGEGTCVESPVLTCPAHGLSTTPPPESTIPSPSSSMPLLVCCPYVNMSVLLPCPTSQFRERDSASVLFVFCCPGLPHTVLRTFVYNASLPPFSPSCPSPSSYTKPSSFFLSTSEFLLSPHLLLSLPPVWAASYNAHDGKRLTTFRVPRTV
jgi:hypothetical protein